MKMLIETFISLIIELRSLARFDTLDGVNEL